MSKELYLDGKYLKQNPTWHSEDSPWKVQQILKIIRRNNLKPKKICEVGCGVGEILYQLSLNLNDDVSFVGYDISPQAIEESKRRAGPRLHFIEGDFLKEKTPLFDIVMGIDVIEHIENYYNFIRQIRGRGKYKIFHIPLDISAQSVLRGSPLMNRRNSVGHIHYFTKETALAALKDTGYTIIDHFYTSSSVDRPSKSMANFLAKLPRKILFRVNQDVAVRILGGYSLMVLTK